MARIAALFDLDGVVLDTERQYDIIWGRIGKKYHPGTSDFAKQIKGMTLEKILTTHFPDAKARQEVERMLYDFEANEMKYKYIAGAHSYIMTLRNEGVQTAVVTSSNEDKMRDVRAHIADFDSLFDTIVTAELTARSKPEPDCFIKGAELLGRNTDECVVFEDSLNGIRAGRAAGMLTVGLSTTFGRERVAAIADIVIDDFVGVSPERFFNIETINKE